MKHFKHALTEVESRTHTQIVLEQEKQDKILAGKQQQIKELKNSVTNLQTKIESQEQIMNKWVENNSSKYYINILKSTNKHTD